MSEALKILLTALATLIGGVILLLITQVVTKSMIEPMQQMREVIGEISYTLTFYANILCNPEVSTAEELSQAKTACRQLAARLEAKSTAVVGYSYFHRLKMLPAKENIIEARSCLIGLSNTSANRPRHDLSNSHLEKIKKLLDLEIRPNQPDQNSPNKNDDEHR